MFGWLGDIVSWFQIGVSGLWPFIWKFGISGVICAGLIALYVFTPVWFAPGIRRWLLPAAGVFAISIVSYAVGVADEHNRKVEQDRLASIRAYEQGGKAADDAQSSIEKSDRLDVRRFDRCGLPTQRRDAYDRYQARPRGKDVPPNCL